MADIKGFIQVGDSGPLSVEALVVVVVVVVVIPMSVVEEDMVDPDPDLLAPLLVTAVAVIVALP